MRKNCGHLQGNKAQCLFLLGNHIGLYSLSQKLEFILTFRALLAVRRTRLRDRFLVEPQEA